MPIYMGETKKTLFKGDYHPAEFYKGGEKITGYDNVTLSGTDLSAENTYNDEVSIIVKGQGKQDSGVTGTNVVLNADFAEGTKYWTLWEAEMSVQGDVMTVLASAQGGGAIQYLMEPEKYVGHMLYSCVWFQTDDPECYFVFLNDGYEQATVKASKTGEFVFLSTVRTIHSDPKWLFIKAQDNRTGDWTTCQFRQPVILDLTAIFGAGNEPSKEQMDKMMREEANWFTGSGKLPQAPTTGYPVPLEASEGALWCEGLNLLPDTAVFTDSTREGDVFTFADQVYDRILRKEYWTPKEDTEYTIVLDILENTFTNEIALISDNRFYFKQMRYAIPIGMIGRTAVNVKTWSNFDNVTSGSIWLNTPKTVTGIFKAKVSILLGTYTVDNLPEYQPYRPPVSIELPVLRAIPDKNGGFSARDSLTSVEGMPGWYDLRREVKEVRVDRLIKNDSTPGGYSYYYYILDAAKGAKLTSHFQFDIKEKRKPGTCTDFNFAYAKAITFWMEGVVSKDNGQMEGMEGNAEATAWVQAQEAAGTPLTVWYPLEEPTTERVYLGELHTQPYYTHMYTDCAVKPQLEATVKTIGGQA